MHQYSIEFEVCSVRRVVGVGVRERRPNPTASLAQLPDESNSRFRDFSFHDNSNFRGSSQGGSWTVQFRFNRPLFLLLLEVTAATWACVVARTGRLCLAPPAWQRRCRARGRTAQGQAASVGGQSRGRLVWARVGLGAPVYRRSVRYTSVCVGKEGRRRERERGGEGGSGRARDEEEERQREGERGRERGRERRRERGREGNGWRVCVFFLFHAGVLMQSGNLTLQTCRLQETKLA